MKSAQTDDLDAIEKEVNAWQKEWDAWQSGANSTTGFPEWQSQEWRYNNDGQKTIPYEATSFPEVFMGKTLMEAKEIISERRAYLNTAKNIQKINSDSFCCDGDMFCAAMRNCLCGESRQRTAFL